VIAKKYTLATIKRLREMKCPCEIIVWEVLPCIRAELAIELVEMGLSQNEISKMLGIAQAAVSQYTTKKRGTKLDFPHDARAAIKKLADDLVHGSVDDPVVRICKICMTVRAAENVCKLDLENAGEKMEKD
jgi:predicted transcriptional regulator